MGDVTPGNTDPRYGWGFPIDISRHGYQVDQLIWAVHVVMATLFIAGAAYLLYVIVRFRGGRQPRAVHAPRDWNIPILVVVALALVELYLEARHSNPILARMRRQFPRPEESLTVRLVAEQYAWNVHYPGRDGRFGRTDPKLVDTETNPLGLDQADPAAADDVTTINQLHVPAGRPIIAHLTSKDVIHGFAVPVLRVRQDCIPGELIPIWFQAEKTGEFEITCGQLCGPLHYRMKGALQVQSPGDFAAWMEAQGRERSRARSGPRRDDDEKETFE
jgi:cytochrome c oxidase subunit 2